MSGQWPNPWRFFLFLISTTTPPPPTSASPRAAPLIQALMNSQCSSLYYYHHDTQQHSGNTTNAVFVYLWKLYNALVTCLPSGTSLFLSFDELAKIWQVRAIHANDVRRPDEHHHDKCQHDQHHTSMMTIAMHHTMNSPPTQRTPYPHTQAEPKRRVSSWQMWSSSTKKWGDDWFWTREAGCRLVQWAKPIWVKLELHTDFLIAVSLRLDESDSNKANFEVYRQHFESPFIQSTAECYTLEFKDLPCWE